MTNEAASSAAGNSPATTRQLPPTSPAVNPSAAHGHATMTQEEARLAITKEFRSLPQAKRESTVERLHFVRQVMEKYKFKCTGHPYQVIRSWLIRELPDENW
jgi:hypothetical protein